MIIMSSLYRCVQLSSSLCPYMMYIYMEVPYSSVTSDLIMPKPNLKSVIPKVLEIQICTKLCS